MKHASFMTTEDGDDLIVSFAIAPSFRIVQMGEGCIWLVVRSLRGTGTGFMV